MAYIAMFSCVIVLSFIYESIKSKKATSTKVLKGFLAFLIVMIPSVMGGLRDVSVGTDNFAYRDLFYLARNFISYNEYLKSLSNYTTEVGFTFLVWLSSKIGGDYRILCFITSFIAMFFFFKGAKYFIGRSSFTIIIMCYLFVYYCPMYNYVRQSIALAICFYAWRYVESKSLFKYVFWVAVAATIHMSAVIMLTVYFLVNSNIKITRRFIAISIAASFFIIYVGPRLIYILLLLFSRLGFRSATILSYAEKFLKSENYLLIPNHLLRSLPQVLFTSFYIKQISIKDEYANTFFLLCFLQLPMTIIASVFEPFSRLSFYFNYYTFVLIGEIHINNTKLSKKFMSAALFLYLVVYWLIFTVNNHYWFAYPVYPYVMA